MTIATETFQTLFDLADAGTCTNTDVSATARLLITGEKLGMRIDDISDVIGTIASNSSTQIIGENE